MSYQDPNMMQVSDEDKVFAILSYISILWIIPLILKKGSEFVKFHIRQGIVLFILELILWVLTWIPFLGVIFYILLVIPVIIFIIVLIKILQGEYFWSIPILGDLAKNIKI